MSIIKETIKLSETTTGATITFALSGGVRFSGYQQEIDNITEETKDDLINPIVDNEVRRFSYIPDNVKILSFFFNSVTPSFEEAGFTTTEIENYSNNLRNSFFIMDYYDTFDPYTQTKIFTVYNTRVLNGSTSGGVAVPLYTLNNDNLNQFYHWNIPKYYLDAYTGSTVTGYTKFSFYNAKTGRIFLFYNKNNTDAGITTPEKMYFKTKLNLTNMTWELDIGATPLGIVRIYEIPRTSAYTERVNDTFENYQNEQQNYPAGTTFIDDGTYVDYDGNIVRSSTRPTTRTPRTR